MASVRTQRRRVPAGGDGRTRGPVRPRGPAWPVRAGMVPPLADGFVTRPETAPGLAAALIPGAVVALVSGRPASDGPRAWGESCGKTQLAVYCAESAWWSREV